MGFKLPLSALSLFLSALLVGISATGAHAYLDAGTGSMILQLILGGAAGLLLAARLYWHRFLSFLGIKSKVTASDGQGGKLAESQARGDR